MSIDIEVVDIVGATVLIIGIVFGVYSAQVTRYIYLYSYKERSIDDFNEFSSRQLGKAYIGSLKVVGVLFVIFGLTIVSL